MSSSKDGNMTTPRGESNRKHSNSRQQTESLRSHKFSEGGFSCTSDCLFCGEGFQKNQNGQFEDMINKALYSKYSSSQNYYYTKDINDILAESRTAAVILFKDYLHADEEEEYLKRFYFYSEYDFKIRMLAEYYKFHNDIARIFILPVINIVNRFHDKKRRLEYIRVTKMLKEEQEQQNPEAKTKAIEEKEEKKNYSITDRVLADLDLTNPDQRNEKRAAKVSKTNQEDKTQSKKKFIEKHKLIYKTGASTKMSELNQNNNKGGNQSRDMSASNTIHDLHLKLGEIISNSRSYNLDTNYLDNNEPQPNETMSNLSNFLLYLNKTSSVSNNTDIPKPEIGFSSSTFLSSALLTERPYRPELTQTSTRTKQSFKGDLTARISDSLVKALSPTSAKTANKMERPPEKIKVKVEERPTGAPVLVKKKSQSESESERSKKIAGITKIKNFEEALKMNLQNSQQKGSTQNSASRDQGQEKYSSNGTLKSANRVSISRTPSKKVIEKPYESSRQQSQPFLSNTSRPSSRTKTRSTDMYSKALDLLLGSNQILLGTQTQKRETMVQGHRSTKSSFNFKIKTPSHQIQTQNERSLGRDDLKLSSGFTNISNRIVSHKLASDRLYLQTEREIKKMGTFGSLNIPQRETKQAPLSDREMRRDYMPKEKEPSKSHVKGMKAVLIMPNETEMSRSGFNSSQVEQRKIGLHKHAKSESRMKKVEGTEKIEIINDVKALLNGSGRSKGIDHSPRRQTFIQNQNNIINVFVNSTQDRKLERNLTLKTERQGYPEGIYQGEFDSLSRIFKSRSPNAEVLIKFNQSVPKRTSQAKNDSDYKNSDFSPMRAKQKDPANANLMRASSDKSPLSYNVAFQRRPGGKSEFEALRKDLRFDHFEMSGRSKEKS